MNEELNQQQDAVAQPATAESSVTEPAAAANTTTQATATENTVAQPAAEKNLMACLGYCPVLFFIPALTGDANKSEVTHSCMNQGLLALITLVCIRLLNLVVDLLPYGISKILNVVIVVFSLAVAVLIVIGMVRAYNNTVFKLPLIGDIDIFKKIKGEN